MNGYICTCYIWIQLFQTQTDTANHPIDAYIKTDTLNDRAIVMSLGNDYLEAVSAIATKNGIVVIDAGISHPLTIKYRKIIEKVFDRNDFAYIINTHAHPDHVGGNKVFREAVIIGHESAPKEITASRINLDKIKSRLLRTTDNYNKQLIASEPGSDEWIRNYCQKIRSSHNSPMRGTLRSFVYTPLVRLELCCVYISDLLFS